MGKIINNIRKKMNKRIPLTTTGKMGGREQSK